MDTNRRRFVSVHVTEHARDALRDTTLHIQPVVGRRLSMSTVIQAALKVAKRHRGEFVTALQDASE